MKHSRILKNDQYSFNRLTPSDELATAMFWGAHNVWHEANESIAYHLHLYRQKTLYASELAQSIKNCLNALFPLMDDLCMITCSHCPDPCCLNARVWFDFRDMLFLHLSEQQIPRRQLIRSRKEICCYLGYRGCTLPRIRRPWACTWYLCPPQSAVLRKREFSSGNIFERNVRIIRSTRKEMEAEFVRIVSF